jgi:Domain of unknown function (DUF4265)
MASDKVGLVKITFELERDTLHGSATESLWATPLGPAQYRLENTPFYARGVSFQDVVLARSREAMLLFVEVFKRGGHSTYRIIPTGGAPSDLRTYWEALRAQGCTYEEGQSGLLAVDVPPEANIFDAYRTLEAGAAAGVWDFEEGHCGHAIA